MQHDEIEHQRLLRLWQVLDLIPISRTAWLNGVRDGRFPSPVVLGPRTVAWRHTEIVELCVRGVTNAS